MMIYKYCKFCEGRGCIACPSESAKAQANQPEPLLSVDPENEQDMRLLASVFRRENIEYVFEKDVDPMEAALTGRGGGMQTIESQAALARLLQKMRKTEQPPTKSEADE